MVRGLNRYFADPRHGPLPVFLLLLTVVTGLVDAVSVLTLGRVFVANMTGNVVFLGFAVAGAAGFSLVASLSALAGFVIGALGGGRMVAARSDNRGLLLRDATVAEAILFALSAVIYTAGASGTPTRSTVAGLLAIAMGIQNAVARYLAVPDLTTSVLTMTITGIAAEANTSGATVVVRRVLAVLVMFGGAALGAVLVLYSHAVYAIGLALALAVIVSACAAAVSREPRDWQRKR